MGPIREIPSSQFSTVKVENLRPISEAVSVCKFFLKSSGHFGLFPYSTGFYGGIASSTAIRFPSQSWQIQRVECSIWYSQLTVSSGLWHCHNPRLCLSSRYL